MNVKSTITDARNTGSSLARLQDRHYRLERTAVLNLCGSTRGYNAMARLLKERCYSSFLEIECDHRCGYFAGNRSMSMSSAKRIERLLDWIVGGSTGAVKAKAKRFQEQVQAKINYTREQFSKKNA